MSSYITGYGSGHRNCLPADVYFQPSIKAELLISFTKLACFKNKALPTRTLSVYAPFLMPNHSYRSPGNHHQKIKVEGSLGRWARRRWRTDHKHWEDHFDPWFLFGTSDAIFRECVSLINSKDFTNFCPRVRDKPTDKPDGWTWVKETSNILANGVKEPQIKNGVLLGMVAYACDPRG